MKQFKSRFSSAERADLLGKSQQCLWIPEGQPGLQYLTNKRGLSESVIRQFGLGYIPHNVNHQLAGRVIFPLYDPSGNLVSLMSRHIGVGETKLPSHWHEHYEKSFYLYAIDQAKEHMKYWGFVVVVEGQIDVLQFFNHGVKNVVALCSTNMSDIQLAMIYRYCDEIILLLDSDYGRAGQIGIKKIMKRARPRGCSILDSMGELERTEFGVGHKINPVYLPNGADPDEYIKAHGIDAIKSLIRDALLQMRGKKCRLISTS